MTENERYIYESIFNHVRMGVYSLPEIEELILEEVEDNGFESEILEEWVMQAIHKEHDTLAREAASWIHPTDTEKLINAFDALCKQNIIALHNAGFTNSDGEYEVVELERALREHDRTSDGYCFYHEQALMEAVSEDPCLYIAFQKVDNEDDAVTLEVGRRVATVLRENGLTVDWDEDVRTKILLPNFNWQRIYSEQGRDLQNYDLVVQMMLD